MDLAANEALAIEFVKTLSTGNVDKAFAWVSDDAIFCVETKLVPSGQYDRRSFQSLLDKLFRSMGNVQQADFLSIASADDRVLTEFEWHVQVRDNTYSRRYFMLLRIVQGKIVALATGPNLALLRKHAQILHLNSDFPKAATRPGVRE